MRSKIRCLAVIVAVDAVLVMLILGMAAHAVRGRGAGPGNDVKTGYSIQSGGESAEKYLALTFDDGPNKKYTELLLDGLRERSVKATFFLTGACIEGNEAVVKRMYEEGHLIGVHCMQHMDLTKMPMEKALEQLEMTGKKIEEVTGVWPEYVRPPYGNWNEKLGQAVLEKLQMIPVFWDVDSLDWKLQNVGKIMKKVLTDVENGDIVLLHDEFSSSVEAALGIVDNLMAKGYTFVTVNELMVD